MLENNRIRYRRTLDNLLESQQTFIVNNQEYTVRLQPSEKKFIVINLVDGSEVITGSGTSAHAVKINAKQALETLGVHFAPEIRKKRKQAV